MIEWNEFLYLQLCKQGRKGDREKLVTHLQLSSRILKDNRPGAPVLSSAEKTLDFTFIYEHPKELYGSTGHPSIDPVVFRSGGRVQVHAHRLPGEHPLRPKAN